VSGNRRRGNLTRPRDPSKELTLETWGWSTYGASSPSVGTLRRWVREEKIDPPPRKHGRSYFVAVKARYVATTSGLENRLLIPEPDRPTGGKALEIDRRILCVRQTVTAFRLAQRRLLQSIAQHFGNVMRYRCELASRGIEAGPTRLLEQELRKLDELIAALSGPGGGP
jgi:Excisionase-like protein